MKWVLAAVAALFTVSAGLTAQEAGQVLTRAAARYAAVQTIRADFVQIIANPMIRGTDTTRGVLALERPNLFSLRFTDPAGDRIVIDGTWLWIYLPSGAPNQVLQRRPPDAGLTSANLFDQFLDRPLERYRPASRGTERLENAVHDIIHLAPLTGDVPFREAELAIGRADGLIRRLDLVELSGQRRRIFFSDVRVDGTIAASEFRFSAPDGARVIRQD